MNLDEVEKIKSIINSIQSRISCALNQNQYLTKVIIIGLTGCGKSSITGCLANKRIIVKEGLGKKAVLEGPGIISGLQSGTKEPSLVEDLNSNILYCDCPGFDDTNGFKQEVINSFIINYLFEVSKNTNIKILIVISASEFEAYRGQGITKIFERISKMFPNPNDIEKEIGLVITKGEIDITNKDFMDQLDYFDSSVCNNWIRFFKSHIDQVFVFPIALKTNIGKIYDFNDHQKLVCFLKNIRRSSILNPIHKIVLSQNATLYMQNIVFNITQNIKQDIRSIFSLLSENYFNENDSLKIKIIIGLMTNIKDRKFQNIIEFRNILHNNGLYNNKFNNIFNNMINNEIIFNFIDKMFSEYKSKIVLNQEISLCANRSIIELYEILKKVEFLEEKRRKEDEYNSKMEEQRRKIEEEKQKQKEIELQIQQQKLIQEQQQLKEAQLRREIEEQQKQIEDIKRKKMESNRELDKRLKTMNCSGHPHQFNETICIRCLKPKCQCGFNHQFANNHCKYCHKPQCECGLKHEIRGNRCMYCHKFKCWCGCPHEWNKKCCKICLMNYNDYLKSPK